MSGFKELTKINSFDFFTITDQYAGKAGVTGDNQLFIVFKARGEDGKLLLVNSSLLTDAFAKGYMKIANYIGTGDYTVSILGSNPDNCDLILKDAYKVDASYYHVIRLERGKLTGRHAVSVVLEMEDNVFETTSLIPASAVRTVEPSFVII